MTTSIIATKVETHILIQAHERQIVRCKEQIADPLFGLRNSNMRVKRVRKIKTLTQRVHELKEAVKE